MGGYKRLDVHLGQSPTIDYAKYFGNWVSGESVLGRLLALFNSVLNCLGLDAEDQDIKGKTKTKNETAMVTNETNRQRQ